MGLTKEVHEQISKDYFSINNLIRYVETVNNYLTFYDPILIGCIHVIHKEILRTV